MNVTVIKEGDVLRVIHSSETIPDGARLVLFSEEALRTLNADRESWVNTQMPSFIRGDEDESAEDLF